MTESQHQGSQSEGGLPRRDVAVDPAAVDPAAIDPSFADGPGLCCPQCGCPDMRVGSTVRLDGRVRRYRYCRHCGRGLPTEEISAAELADLRRRAQ